MNVYAAHLNRTARIAAGRQRDQCGVYDPGFELDLCVTTDLRTMTAIWMGRTRVRDQLERIKFAGDRGVASRMQDWLGLSPFARG